MSVIQTIHLSVLEDSIPQTIPAVQNDTDRSVKMIIDDLTLTSGMTGTLNFKRSDGSHYGYTATLDTSDNSFTAPLDQALTQPGRTYCQLKVTDSDVVSTFTFIVNVTKDVSGTVTEQEGIDLVSAVQAAEDAADRAESAAETLELDATLTKSGKAADAAAVGNALANFDIEVDATLTQEGEAADAKATGDAITDLTNVVKNNFKIQDNAPLPLTADKFINGTNGNIVDQSGFSLITPIPVFKGQKITLTAAGWSNTVCMIATCNADNTTRTVVVRSRSANVEEYVYYVQNDGYITGSFVTAKDHSINIDIDYYKFVNPLEEAMIFSGDKLQNLSIAIDHAFVNASTGNINTNNDFAIFNTITLYKGQSIKLTARGYNTSVGMINGYDPYTDKYVCLVPSIDSTEREYVYTATETIKVRVSCNKQNPYTCVTYADKSRFIITDTVNDLLYVTDDGIKNVIVTDALTGYFVNASTDRTSAQSGFSITNSIHLHAGQTIEVTATGYNTAVGMICLYDSNDDTYITVVSSIDSTEQKYSYTATEECDIRCSYNNTNDISINIVTDETISVRLDIIESDITDLKNSNLSKVEYPQMFDNILCIGDSLTVGASGNGSEILEKNYPHFLEKLAVAGTTIKGHGGYTTKQVWDSYISVATDLSNYDCAIIYLGTNGGLTDTVSTDCNAADYTQNADTNTGCYGKIIGKIKADAPNCKIFCVAGPSEYMQRETTMNPAVRDLAELYNVGLVDLYKSILDDNEKTTSKQRYLYRPVDGIHYNVLGYMTLANLIYDYMKEYMRKHLTSYAD